MHTYKVIKENRNGFTLINRGTIKENRNGFTLIELLVSIAIIAVVTAAGAMVYNSLDKAARNSRRISNLKDIKAALESYKIRRGTYPKTGDCTNAGQWYTQCANNVWSGECAGQPTGHLQKPSDEVIPGLVPEFISHLPEDKLMNSNPALRTDDYCYFYQSDGINYKVLIGIPENTNLDYRKYLNFVDSRYDHSHFIDSGNGTNTHNDFCKVDPHADESDKIIAWGVSTQGACLW